MMLEPAETPVTTPDELTEATAILLLDQAPVPPPKTTELAEYVADPPIQMGVAPETEAMLALGTIVKLIVLLVVIGQLPSVIVQ